ncbi:multiple epidermal growth factor-like domains 6 [Plakobranchus ocellatus]|uniref:Multiple epidermal growth factor-like domains 6 n=1 Tax=Plakobranchus ocellatus TaxID=259542 RepID=A0AAV4DVI6_9GAST|nr:multiple epidermal growth factor-like domains 6 [Plakobranchus ocellatus]
MDERLKVTINDPGLRRLRDQLYDAKTLQYFYITELPDQEISHATCPRNTFGNQCKYQCHCANGAVCDPVLGTCPGSCGSGFFGPACQYYASTFEPIERNGLELTWLVDNDDKTCNNESTNNITVILDTPHPITWIRVVVNDSIQPDHFQLAFQNKSSGEIHWPCQNPQTAIVDRATMDILCRTPVAIKFLTVSGPGVLSLCSLHISAGRNVALNQTTNLTELYWEWYSKNVVDGRFDAPYDSQYSLCSLTNSSDEEGPWWTLKFFNAVDINQILLYSETDRLAKFSLSIYPTASLKSMRQFHIDPDQQEFYTLVISPKLSWPASRIKVQSASSENPLSLCEIIVLGVFIEYHIIIQSFSTSETVCPQGTFGRECEHECNCADEKPCFVSTGGCPTGCAPGFTGEDCMTGEHECNCADEKPCFVSTGGSPTGCAPGFTGEDCMTGEHECNCADEKPCFVSTGGCPTGCAPGFTDEDCMTGTCPRSTFGNQCKYQCHCANGAVCDPVLGTCPGPCGSGFFGPACQYYATTYEPIERNGLDLTWLVDNDDKTCNNESTDNITVILDPPHPITWIRVVVNDSIQPDNFQLAFQNSSIQEMRWPCQDLQTSRVNGKTMDILCKTPVAIKFLTVSGPGLLSLCSLHISAGRNVALNQATSQSKTFLTWYSENAVDGRIGVPFKSPGSSCSVTAPLHEELPWWMVKFFHNVEINQILFYNIRSSIFRGCCETQDTRIIIRYYLTIGTRRIGRLNTHPDPHDVIRRVPFVKIAWPVSRIEVQGASSGNPLSLCEVIVLGETACSPGTFGRECEHKCNCADEKPCFVSTGGCPTGCAPGFTGEDCMTECDKDKYGSGCAETCSMNCSGSDKSCRHTDGLCVNGCEAGYKEPLCKDRMLMQLMFYIK